MSNNQEKDGSANRVMTFAEVAEATGISLSTLRREIARGCGPEVVSLSPRRKGVRSDSYRRWLDARTSAALSCLKSETKGDTQ
jgi:predicted DNA-binding transcriptional regulator AlpA